MVARAPKVAFGALASGARHGKRKKKRNCNNNCLVPYSFSGNNVARICIEKLIFYKLFQFRKLQELPGALPQAPSKAFRTACRVCPPRGGGYSDVVWTGVRG